ncbi:MAG: C-GCAxxG-C-C family protein [Lachnospiraceae bacterium]|nr:C-GCAxxG-C-C family protein [Lachnospiraceae bacterium]
MDRVKRAEEYFLQGYNCSQAVFAAFSDRYGIDEATALRLTSTLGGGIASRREVCGALNALSMVCGLETGGSEVNHELKKASYRGNRELLEEFENEYGSILCRELLATAKKRPEKDPAERTAEYYAGRPCLAYVRAAAEILERHFPEKAGE